MGSALFIEKKNKNYNAFSLIYVIYAFLSLWLVCSADSTLFIPLMMDIRKIVAFLVLLLFFVFFSTREVSVDKKSLSFCIFPVIYYLFSFYNHYDNDHIASFVSILLLIVFVALDGSTKLQIYALFRKLLFVISILGIICYVAYLLGVPLPHYRVDYYDSDRYTYIYYYVSVLVEGDGLIRLCGLFNEPGYLGTILGLVLSLDIIFHKKALDSIVFFVAGLLTLSLAFFLTIICCYVLKQVRTPSRWIFVLSVVTFYLFILPNIHTGNNSIDHIIERVSINEEGKISGDNRSNLQLDFLLLQTLSSDKVFWGNGMGYVKSYEMNVSSFKTIIVDNGVICFVTLYIIFMVFLLYRYRKHKETYPFIIIFFINVYQRPNIYNIVFFVVLFCGLNAIVNKKTDSR